MLETHIIYAQKCSKIAIDPYKPVYGRNARTVPKLYPYKIYRTPYRTCGGARPRRYGTRPVFTAPVPVSIRVRFHALGDFNGWLVYVNKAKLKQWLSGWGAGTMSSKGHNHSRAQMPTKGAFIDKIGYTTCASCGRREEIQCVSLVTPICVVADKGSGISL